jgi:hypothetical protein
MNSRTAAEMEANKGTKPMPDAICKKWLVSTAGFKPRKYQGKTALARQITKSALGDDQWIELACETNGIFVLCRWSPMYDDDGGSEIEVPPDSVDVHCSSHESLLALLKLLCPGDSK